MKKRDLIQNRWAYGAIALTALLCGCKLMGWLHISWLVALLPVLLPLLLVFVFALAIFITILAAFVFYKKQKEESSHGEDASPEGGKIYFNEND